MKVLMPRFICSLPDLKHAASMNHVFEPWDGRGWGGVGGHRHNGQWEGGWRAEPSFFRPDEARFAEPNLEGVLAAPAVRYLQSVAARSRSNHWTGLPAPHALPSTKLCGGLHVRRGVPAGAERTETNGAAKEVEVEAAGLVSEARLVSAHCLPANPSHPPTPLNQSRVSLWRGGGRGGGGDAMQGQHF